jgi:hypothetical protein
MEGYSIDSDAHGLINCRGAKLYQYENSNSDEKLVKEIGMLISNQNFVQ